jgi:flagella basal body P-ring formation protein FlgA
VGSVKKYPALAPARLLPAWLSGCVCLGLAAPAAAQVPPPSPAQAQIPAATLAQGIALATEAAQVLAPAGARVTVEAGMLDPRLQLAPCTRVEPYTPAGTPAWGRTRLGLRCTDGRARWNVSLPLNVSVVAPAWVAATALPAGTPLTEAQLKRVDVEWSASSSPLFDRLEPLLGRSLSRPLVAGQPVQAAQLLARQWFAAGDTVRIQASGAGYSVVGEGQALGPGVEGKSVRVQTENGRVLLGKPVSDRCVEVVL